MSYEEQTKNAYRNKEKAAAYLSQYIEGTKWARFTMWKQKRIVKNFMKACNFNENDVLLDAPCGTGYAGKILFSEPCQVVASDISLEMMELATNEYEQSKFLGFYQADITSTPFRESYFKCVLVLALMHRLPEDIRKLVLEEVHKISSEFAIISFSESSLVQDLKQKTISIIKKSHIPAPASIPISTIEDEIKAAGFTILKRKNIFKFFSAKLVYLLKK